MDWPAASSAPAGESGRDGVAGTAPSPRRVPRLAIACGYAGLLLVAGFGTAPWLGVAAGLALTGLIFLPGLRRGDPASLAASILAGTVFLLLGAGGAPRGWLDGLPVLINSALALLFGRTLADGREPLIACAIRAVEGPARLEVPGIASYARGLTGFWAVLFGAQALLAVVVLACRPGGWLDAAGLAAPELFRRGAWVTALHFGGLAVVAAALVGEYAFRRCWLRHVPHVPLPVFVLRLARAWPALLQSARAGTR
ncbi:MAG: xanthomonadin biosynthesis protein [Xanthomonadales bacterium]|nr:xanthomonadin biosynthesis protein [Xanthomonadales bacterium]